MRAHEAVMTAPDVETLDFGMEEFDLDAAFNGAIQDVVDSDTLALDEKVRRMEAIVTEASSEFYHGFIDFTNMAAQIEMMCNHDHSLDESVKANEVLSNFLIANRLDQQEENNSSSKSGNSESEVEKGSRRGKRRKKVQGFLENLFKKYRNRKAQPAARFSLFG